MKSEKVYLYDTVLISRNEQTYFKTEELLVRDFIGDSAIIVIEAVYKEMLAANKSEKGLSQRYVDYLTQFKTVIYIDEACLFNLVGYKYNRGIVPNMRKVVKKAFKSRIELVTILSDVEMTKTEQDILNHIHDSFNDGRNFGEYSLMWTAFVIHEIFPRTLCNFIGADNDLFGLYLDCYLKEEYSVHNSDKPFIKAWISSTETILASKIDEDYVHRLISSYRDTYAENRKIIYREYLNGILSHHLVNKVFTNDIFYDEVKNKLVHIVY